MLGPLLEVEMSKKRTLLRREAHVEGKMCKKNTFEPPVDVQPHHTTLHYMNYTLHYNYNCKYNSYNYNYKNYYYSYNCN